MGPAVRIAGAQSAINADTARNCLCLPNFRVSDRRTDHSPLEIRAEQVGRIDVHKDRLIVRFKSTGTEEASHSTDGQMLSIPWQKPPSRKSRQILIPLGVPRNEGRPTALNAHARFPPAIPRL